ncbi:ANTAR domain-containing protein [Microbacterium sp. KSW4-11]|uniref:ANTAR domain-containing protein n=1 Tax=Microbacterium gawkjiense TaxID=3067309 RepID=A0ABU3GBV3_9MICO|nr:ANTAR domain-containing protein [Microbacterium sp. KSW4-11]MDT3316985.1 ANTAR domain-containing protein [Microbacterium sp. KSW4-11]
MEDVVSNSGAAEDDPICAVFMTMLPVHHVGVSTLAPPFDVETVCASDLIASALEEIQLDSGVGPGWTAHATGAPVLIHDLRESTTLDRTGFHAAAADRGVRSIYAFPMAVGMIEVGAVDLYVDDPDALKHRDVALASAMAEAAALRIFDRVLAGEDIARGTGGSSRRIVHQATGMVCAQLRVSPDDALIVIRAHAFASGRSVLSIAESIISREIDFTV